MDQTSVPAGIRQVLFVCTGNSCRSVMAEKLFEKAVREKGLDVSSGSAGLAVAANYGASPETVDLLRAEGVEAAGHVSRQAAAELVRDSDLICVMTLSHREHLLREFPDAAARIRLLTDFYPGEDKRYYETGVPDPIGMGKGFYDNVFAVIKDCIAGLTDGMKKA